jgi:hypothetical protein
LVQCKFTSLNLNKTQYLEFCSINCCNTVTQINYDQKIISNVTETKFLGLTIDDVLSWKQHIDLQKKIIRIMTNAKPRDSCRDIFKKLEIMTLFSQYIYSLLLYIINNNHTFNFILRLMNT